MKAMMYIDDDAEPDTVVRVTIDALSECARSVGKIGCSFDIAQVERMELAMRHLQSALDLKRRLIDA